MNNFMAWLMSFELHVGDCIEVMRTLPDNSVDAVVTDPPYELGFMNKDWDKTGIANSVEMWSEVLRVLKPGGHLLSFGGSRTYHRMACAVEDAGFEIRDQIMWLYGSGFPKSHNVSKAIDSQLTLGGSSQTQMRKRGMGDEYRPHKNAGIEGFGDGNLRKGADGDRDLSDSVGIQTGEAKQWDGWGTALKPAHEPILVARKPFKGTVAANVLAHGTGVINIDACRVEPTGESRARIGEPSQERRYTENGGTNFAAKPGIRGGNPIGRWPANVIHDGSEDVLGAFPDAPGQLGDLKGHNQGRESPNGIFGAMGAAHDHMKRVDSGSASRFFYCAKASKKDRDEGLEGEPDRVLAMSNQAKAQLDRGVMHQGDSGMNTAKVRKNNHPTVKPTELMRYLCRLVTQPGGAILDPLMGSGSTGKAAMLEGFRFIGIEMTPEYVEIARARIQAVAPDQTADDITNREGVGAIQVRQQLTATFEAMLV